MNLKIPVSVLVVIHTAALEVLLLQRAARPEFWQSVTGSLDRPDEPLEDAAQREVREETGVEAPRERLLRWNVINTFRIWEQWRHRYPPGTTHNTEHVFSLQVPGRVPVRLDASEHLAFLWLPWQEAADKCASWSNREAIAMLPQRLRVRAA
ncbi:MAG TPA: dihydroneopterin triphosphate diphosphatase [Burkholderiales bacterium]|nr:dihydroneopterin triphosphate diphosphatase [Burkholderiales bacterium]